MKRGNPRKRRSACVARIRAALVVGITITLAGVGGAGVTDVAERDSPRDRVVLNEAVVSRLRDDIGRREAGEAWDSFCSRLPHGRVSGSWAHSHYEDLVGCAFASTVDPTREQLGRIARVLLELACRQDRWCQRANVSRPISLYTGATACGVALAYNWMYARLDEGERERVRGALERLAFRPFLKAAEQKTYPFGEYRDNWCSVINSGIGVAAAIMAGNSESASRALPICRRQIVGVLDEVEGDGGWAEGLNYWGWVITSILRYGFVLRGLGMESAVWTVKRAI